MAAALVGRLRPDHRRNLLLWPGPSGPGAASSPTAGATLFIYTRTRRWRSGPGGRPRTTWPMAPSRRFQPGSNWDREGGFGLIRRPPDLAGESILQHRGPPP